MINGRRIPMNGDPWQNWVTRELKAQREELKAQRQELKAQRSVQREIIGMLDKHEKSLRDLAGMIRQNTLDLHEHTRQIAGLTAAVGVLNAAVGALTTSVERVTVSVGAVTASVAGLTATVGTLHERVEGGFRAVDTKLDRILKKLG